MDLNVEIISASNFPMVEGVNYNTYVAISVGNGNDSKQTSIEDENPSSPKWKEIFTFHLSKNSNVMVTFILYNSIKNEPISQLIISTGQFQFGEIEEKTYSMKPYKGIGNGGNLKLKIQLAPPGHSPFTPFNGEKPKQISISALPPLKKTGIFARRNKILPSTNTILHPTFNDNDDNNKQITQTSSFQQTKENKSNNIITQSKTNDNNENSSNIQQQHINVSKNSEEEDQKPVQLPKLDVLPNYSIPSTNQQNESMTFVPASNPYDLPNRPLFNQHNVPIQTPNQENISQSQQQNYWNQQGMPYHNQHIYYPQPPQYGQGVYMPQQPVFYPQPPVVMLVPGSRAPRPKGSQNLKFHMLFDPMSHPKRPNGYPGTYL